MDITDFISNWTADGQKVLTIGQNGADREHLGDWFVLLGCPGAEVTVINFQNDLLMFEYLHSQTSKEQ